jgi:hypothetical protein
MSTSSVAIWVATGYQGRMAEKPEKPDHKWRIIHLKGTPAKTIGYVEAPDADSAIKKAIEEFKIEPAIRGRLVAERWG